MRDRGDDSDPLRGRLRKGRGIELVCPHRNDRKRVPTQDGRELRRSKRRWVVERTSAWPGNDRRLVIRHHHSLAMYQAFFHVPCLLTALKKL